MISRVADHCFWFGRYLERTESMARMLAVTQHLALDAELSPSQCWMPVVIVAGQKEHFAAQHGEEAAADGELVQRYMSLDEDNPTSLCRSISAARWNARSIREVVSLEAWETANELHLWINSEEAREEFRSSRYAFYQRARHLAQLCLGLTQSTMLHDTPLDFIWLGVLLERVGQTARTLDVHHHALTQLEPPLAESNGQAQGGVLRRHRVVETALWLSLLRACSGFEPFMKLNQGQVNAQAVAQFLLFEPRFPRSIRHCVHAAFARLCEIRPPESATLPGGESLERLHLLHQWVADRAAEPFDPLSVHAALTHVVDETATICDGIGRELLGYGPPDSHPPSTSQ
ncbi:alpha-E domain-containing protein [Sorangium sp. So ce1024]|uniref:alpha-E domain-containing protein n=1 Tax=unclassified Sorangium TaxID=2621164 RepID=UPI003F003AD6